MCAFWGGYVKNSLWLVHAMSTTASALPVLSFLSRSQKHSPKKAKRRLVAMKTFCPYSLCSHLNVLTIFPLIGWMLYYIVLILIEGLNAFRFFFKTKAKQNKNKKQKPERIGRMHRRAGNP